MASSNLLIVILSLLLVGLAFPLAMANEEFPTKTMEKKVHVVVEGMVYCQSCEHYGAWSLSGAESIPLAKVSVLCKDHKNRVNYYKVFETDIHGYFYAQLDGFKMGHSILVHPLQSCSVKLVSSPLKSCNLLSNVNYGLYGSPLRYENKRLERKNYEAVIYAAGPLAFRSAHCSPANHN